jgi:hypothetical protein
MKRQGAERIEVNLDDIKDDDSDNEGLLGAKGPPGLFTIKESHDRGLADMETGSEVYMSELLVSHSIQFTIYKAGFDMEDFDEAEEQNEEDLLELGDAFGSINLKNHVQDTMNELVAKDKAGADYILYCVKQLNIED